MREKEGGAVGKGVGFFEMRHAVRVNVFFKKKYCATFWRMIHHYITAQIALEITEGGKRALACLCFMMCVVCCVLCVACTLLWE